MQIHQGISRLVSMARIQRTTDVRVRAAIYYFRYQLGRVVYAGRLEVLETMAALGALVARLELGDVYAVLEAEPLSVRQRVGTKFMWMRDQAQRISAGRPVDFPYRCRIGDRYFRHADGTWATRPVNDLEFWSLLHFLPLLTEVDGRRWLPNTKREGETMEPPDFDVLDLDTRELMGIECTECVQSFSWARQQDAEAEVLRELRMVLGNVFLFFRDVRDWIALKDDLSSLSSNLRGIRPRSRGGERAFDFTVGKQHLRGTIKRSPEFNFMTFKGDGSVGSVSEEQQAQQLISSLEAKNRKKGELKLTPSILLLYPNNDLVLPNMRTAAQLASKVVSDSMQNRFSEMWSLSRSGDSAYRIY